MEKGRLVEKGEVGWVLAYFGAIIWRLASCTEVMCGFGCEANHNRMFSFSTLLLEDH